MSGNPFPGRDDLWLDDGVVVRRHDNTARETVEWIHRFLDQLSFNAPVPVPYFEGASVVVIEGVVWGALSYVDGETVDWSPDPGMFELGAFLAAFHEAAEAVEIEAQQSPVLPVDTLVLPIDVLERIGHGQRARHVIHGDFTNHNVVAAGSPLAPCGVIDFANAYVEVPLADIGFALWRSGRPAQDVHEFDPARIAAYIDGYSSVRPLSADDRAAVIVYLRARGIQIIAKQAARGVTDDGPVRKLEWLSANEKRMVQTVMGTWA